MKYKCITVREPWASLIIFGPKDVENRSWSTTYRGPLVIHAANEICSRYNHIHDPLWRIVDCFVPGYPNRNRMNCGCAIGVIDLVDVVPGDECQLQWAQPDFGGGAKYAWLLERPRLIFPTPIKMRGMPGLFDCKSDELRAAIESAVPKEKFRKPAIPDGIDPDAVYPPLRPGENWRGD